MTDNGITVGDWGTIQIKRFVDASNKQNHISTWSGAVSMPYKKYSIKEEDMRIKTASFVSPNYIDLTTGQYAIRIVSKYHENFAGILLDVDYDEDTDLYTYQCQDFSRLYMGKCECIWNKSRIYDGLLQLLAHGQMKKKISRKGFEDVCSGLRALKYYDQSLYPNQHYKGNPFKQNISLISRDKTEIELIRSLVFSRLGYFDIYFNDCGILQIKPLSKTDWENTGLHLSSTEYANRKFKFSTANAITGVVVNGSDASYGPTYKSKQLTKLDLKAFFGNVTTSISDPVQKSATKKTSNAVKNKNNSATVNKDNPYGTKNKEVWVNMDEAGSGSSDWNYINKICSLLEKNGWKVHNMGVGANIHTDSNQFSKCHDGIWWTIDNGMDPGTIRHLGYDSWCAGSIMKRGGRCVFACMMDNTKKYWVEKGCDNWYDLHEAHDDGYSAGDTYLKYPAGYMAWSGLPFMTAKNYDAGGMVAQFLKGGVSQEALKMSNWKNHKGNYYIRSGWSSKY